MTKRIGLLTAVLAFLFSFSLDAQVKNVQKEAEKQGTRRINQKIDEGIDSGFDAIEEGIGSLFGKKKKKKKGQPEQVNTSFETQGQNNTPANGQSAAMPNSSSSVPQNKVEWAKYDFVPGDEVIFEDGPDIMEENGEFPSRWDLVKGQTEIANVNGENVIMFIDGSPTIIPYIENSKEDYLPEIFTIEFDLFRPSNGNRFSVYLSDLKNQKHGQEIEISHERVTVDEGDIVGIHPERNNSNWREKAFWTHVSIAFTKGKLKVYLDETRVVNIPRYQKNPTGLTLQAYWAELAEDKAFYVKNVRIAKGGVKYYDRVLSDGKIICNGIRFDVNKASLKPESMGPINKIFELMQKQPDLKFSVEGHTDADGDDARNQTLSEQRAKTVMNQLISMGISANRLKSAGFGESKPLDNNNTPEGKANNRRVEFVKFTGNVTSASSSAGAVSTAGNAQYDALDRKSIAKKLDALPEQINIPVSNNNGMQNGAGTVILYATSDGNLGKMEILNVDKNDGYKLTTRFVTYNYNGSVHSESNNLEIEGTYTCDLDKGKVGGDVYSEQDLRFGKQDSKTTTIYPGETAILRVLK